LTCKEFIDFLSAYLDGELSVERKLLFDKHLTACPDCVAYMDSYNLTIGLLNDKSLPTDSDVPADVPQSLLDAILAAQPK